MTYLPAKRESALSKHARDAGAESIAGVLAQCQHFAHVAKTQEDNFRIAQAFLIKGLLKR
jgi:hypothetical protein